MGVVLLVFTAVSPDVHADCTSPSVMSAEEAIEALNNLRSDGCLGGNACTTPLCVRINTFVKKWCGENQALFCAPTSPSPEIFPEAKGLVLDLRKEAENLPSKGAAAPQLLGMMGRWNDVFHNIGKTPVSGARITEWDTGGMRLFPDTVYMVDVERLFAERCAAPEVCRESLDSVREVYTATGLTQRILGVLAGSDVEGARKRIERLDARWHAYHNETRAIFPWEILINGWLIHRPAVRGFTEPPERQILFLHPSAGLGYRSSGDDRLQEAIILDVIGLYWWKWGGEKEAEVEWPMGLSLAASYDGLEPSYGVMAHFPKNWSLGVVSDRHGDLSLLLSVDFGNFVTEKKSAVEKLRNKFD
jgi:hypothetical protein